MRKVNNVYFLSDISGHLDLSQEEDEDFEEESDDDDTAALLAELEKIKKERAEEQARKVVLAFIPHHQVLSRSGCWP